MVTFLPPSCAVWPYPQAGEAEDASGNAECHEQHDEQQPATQPAPRQPDAVGASHQRVAPLSHGGPSGRPFACSHFLLLARLVPMQQPIRIQR